MKQIIAALLMLGFIPHFKSYIFGISLGASGGTSSSSSGTTIDETKTAEEKKTGTETAKATSTTEQTSTGTTTGKDTTTASGIETSTLSLLSEEDQNLISNLMKDIAGGSAGNEELLSLLESRALNADEAFSGIVDPQVEEARRLQEQDLGQSVSALSRATGGGAKSNSLVAGFDLEGQRAIDSSIASLAATLGIDARQAGTEEITGAFEAGLTGDQASSSAVAQLATVLKGAEQTGTKELESTEVATSVEDVIQQLSAATDETEIKSIIENLFSTEHLTGTEHTSGKGKSIETSVGGSIGF